MARRNSGSLEVAGNSQGPEPISTFGRILGPMMAILIGAVALTGTAFGAYEIIQSFTHPE